MRLALEKKLNSHSNNTVYNFQSMKSPVELNIILFIYLFIYAFYFNSFVVSPGLIRRDIGRLANEAFTPSTIFL